MTNRIALKTGAPVSFGRPVRQIKGLFIGALAAMALIIAGCAATQPTPQQRASYLEPILAAAGFRMVPAQTAEKMTRLNTLPPLQVNYFLDKEGVPQYWFADPYQCRCLYVGNQDNYREYEDLRIRDRISQRNKEAAEENLEASRNMQMNMMTPWGFWGPGWGPYWP